MTIVINGDGTITGLAVGGLPDGVVDTDMLAANAVATSKIADNAVTSAKSSGLGGLAMMDQWRLSAGHGESNNFVLSNWERNDNNFAQIGTGMTHSSGVFTFPATGIYRIDFHNSCKRNDNPTQPSIRAILMLSTDSGSNFSNIAESIGHLGGAYNSYQSGSCCACVDVTNASTFRIRCYIEASTHMNYEANTDEQITGLTFMKLGDT